MESLLERECELAAVEGLLAGGGAALVVEGGVGLGKTVLVEAACRRAADLGREVLRARGSGLEAGFADLGVAGDGGEGAHPGDVVAGPAVEEA